MIASIALATPDTMHWLPTKETGIVKEFKDWWQDDLPKNLALRISASKVDRIPSPAQPGSMVYADAESVPTHAHKCPIYSDPALKSANCAEAGCFACWDKSVALVAYPKH